MIASSRRILHRLPTHRIASAAVLTGMLTLVAPTRMSHAQDVAFEAALRDSVVVTATRHSTDLRQTGRRVSVLTARDIEHLPAASFDELIRYLGGVETQSRGGFGVQSDITMRGSSFEGIVVLLDGIRLHDPQTGHFMTNFPVPISEIARIEVVRGPAASLYGPDAVGGVIQFFTWSGLSERDPGSGLAAEFSLGRHALYDADAAIRTRLSGINFSAATTWEGSNGQPIRDSEGHKVIGSEGEIRTDFRRQSHTLAASGQIGPSAVLARAGLDVRDFGSWHFYTPFASDTARSDSRTAWMQVRLRSADRTAPTHLSVHAGARVQESSYQYNSRSAANSHTNYTTTIQADAIRQANGTLTLGTGLSAGLRGIDSNSMGRHSDASVGAYATARYRASSRLTVNASGRIDRDPGFGTEITPQLTLAYGLHDLTVRAGAGRAVRSASYTERYYDTERANPAGNLGNPDLRAERAWAYEAGADAYLGRLSLHGTVFRRDATDLIDYARIDLDQPIFLARNIASVVTHGLELDAEASVDVGEARLRYVGSYAWLHSELDVPDGVQYKYALTHARHIIQQNVYVYGGRAGLGLRGLWKAPMSGDRFFVVDLSGSYRLSREIALTAEVRNVLDIDYAEVFDAPMPRRWWLIGVRYR
jgi:vitamin B12 transporter